MKKILYPALILTNLLFSPHAISSSFNCPTNTSLFACEVNSDYDKLDVPIDTILTGSSVGLLIGDLFDPSNNIRIAQVDIYGNIYGVNSSTFLERSNIDLLNNYGIVSSPTSIALYSNYSRIGQLNNNATFEAGTQGFEINGSSIDAINNSGIIQGGFSSIYSLDSNISIVDNSGLISGGQFGIFSFNSGLERLNNSGSINGALSAIYLADHQGDTVINHNSGIISSDQNAIYVRGATPFVTLNWNGGLIEGGLDGLNVLNLNHNNALLGNNGDLHMPQDSIIRMKITADYTQPILKVNEYSFGSGSKILLTPSAQNFNTNNQRYTLISGMGDATSTLSIHSESPYLTVTSSERIDGIDAIISVNQAPHLSQTPESATNCGQRNAQVTANSLAPLLSQMAATSPENKILQMLAGSNAEQATRQLVPIIHNAEKHITHDLYLDSTRSISERLNAYRQRTTHKDTLSNAAWLSLTDDFHKQKNQGCADGYISESKVFTTGLDSITGDFIFGLSYSNFRADIRDINLNQLDTQGNSLTLYSSLLGKSWFLESNFGLGITDNKSNRLISDSYAKSNYNSKFIALGLSLGYSYHIKSKLTLEPILATNYTNITIEDHYEKGSIAALAIDSQRYKTAEVGAGFRIYSKLPSAFGTFNLRASSMLFNEYINDKISKRSRFVFGGEKFNSFGPEHHSTRYENMLAIEYILRNSIYSFSYTHNSHSDSTGRNSSLQLTYKF